MVISSSTGQDVYAILSTSARRVLKRTFGLTKSMHWNLFTSSSPLVQPFGYALFVVGMIGMLIATYWLTMRLIFHLSNNSLRINLNFVSLLLTLVGCFCTSLSISLGQLHSNSVRIIWLVLPPNALDIRYDYPKIVPIVSALFVTFPICLWLCANCLIVGFWYSYDRSLHVDSSKGSTY